MISKWISVNVLGAFAVAMTFVCDSRGDCIAAAYEIQLSPAALAVAGLSHQDAEAILLRLHEEDELRESLGEAGIALDVANTALTAAAIAYRHAPLSSTAASDLAAAELDVHDARAALASVRTQLLAAALYGVSTTAVDVIEAWTDTVGHQVPDEFRVLSRTSSEWIVIEEALRAEKRAVQRGETLDSEHASLLQSIRSDNAVIAASLGIQTNLAAIQYVFEQFNE